MNLDIFIRGFLNIIGDTVFNENKKEQISDYVYNNGMNDFVKYGTNRVCVLVPDQLAHQVLPQELQNKGKFVLKFAYNGTSGYSDNLREMEITSKAGMLGLFAQSYGFLYEGKVLVQEQLKGITSESEMQTLNKEINDFYNLCDRNGVVIKDGTKLSHLNFGTSYYDGKFKTLDYAYYNVLSVPNQNNLNKVFLQCVHCGTGKLTYKNKIKHGVTGRLSSYDVSEIYICDNPACVSYYNEATKEIKVPISPEAIRNVLTNK